MTQSTVPAPVRKHVVLNHVPLLDELLDGYASAIGRDFTAYRNHTYRVVNFCVALSEGEPEIIQQKAAIAAAFHDLGIWTDATFDYLPPSERLAQTYLAASGNAAWEPEIRDMIHYHHKITRYARRPDNLVETFREADWVDVSRGLLRFGLPRRFPHDVFAAFPNAGFHRKLVQLSAGRFVRHPLNPLPMFKV